MRAAAFDELAGDYDADFTHSPVGSALRAIVAGRFEQAFQAAQRVLDLGSGTGEDAVRVARSGANVLDASAAMVRATQEKARRGGCADRAQFRCLPIESLGTAETDGLFDGASAARPATGLRAGGTSHIPTGHSAPAVPTPAARRGLVSPPRRSRLPVGYPPPGTVIAQRSA